MECLSRYIPCTVCNESAKYITTYKYKGEECYLCEKCHSKYTHCMSGREDMKYPGQYYVHESVIYDMIEEEEVKSNGEVS